MKYFLFCLIACTFLISVSWAAKTDSLRYVNAADFSLIGKGFHDTKDIYDRLPARLEGKTRQTVWNLSKNCSGLAVRFRTSSPVIAARWEVTKDVTMNHFAPSGIKGLDLYCLENGRWQFVNTARPVAKQTTAIIIDNQEVKDREYMLYLPLYDGVVSLEIGINPSSVIGNPLKNSPEKEKPVVFYGTSITQGGCASRAGMAYPAILSRMLDRQTINLGFSGNGQLDPEIAEVMSEIDASCYVIDCLPNVTVAQMNDKYLPFLKIIRDKKPDVPILLIENILFPHLNFDQTVQARLTEKNQTLHRIFLEQKRSGDRHIYYMKADLLIGLDQEATVDGVHLTDLGFLRMAQGLYPTIRKLIKHQ